MTPHGPPDPERLDPRAGDADLRAALLSRDGVRFFPPRPKRDDAPLAAWGDEEPRRGCGLRAVLLPLAAFWALCFAGGVAVALVWLR